MYKYICVNLLVYVWAAIQGESKLRGSTALFSLTTGITGNTHLFINCIGSYIAMYDDIYYWYDTVTHIHPMKRVVWVIVCTQYICYHISIQLIVWVCRHDDMIMSWYNYAYTPNEKGSMYSYMYSLLYVHAFQLRSWYVRVYTPNEKGSTHEHMYSVQCANRSKFLIPNDTGW